ncbi:60S ribosomal protein L34 [Cyanidiococcus yangmingshanensis]|uniref:60S ribosomal protein L34 n=1 Tax=Cyanidiococcus yangmingshanensis TaxID=2690220 RepID=A0A7J7ILW8_9RHOD|nr:60S ribosomal protein L34 [Cyanidiococcus yangmingshanensis]
MPDKRITLRKRKPYATRSNKIRKVKTPGGVLTVHYLKKQAKPPRCGDTGVKLNGMPVRRPREYARLSKPKKSVSRAYGGALCGAAVRDRIQRAFLIEEAKIVKRVLRQQEQAARQTKKAAEREGIRKKKSKKGGSEATGVKRS